MKKPNVLILYTDQQRKDTLQSYGCGFADTPNIDALAADALILDQYFVQNPVCMPSRASFLSGMYPSSLRIGINGIEFPPDIPTAPSYFNPFGYETAQFGKLHFLPHCFRDHNEIHPSYGFQNIIVSDEPGCYDDPYTAWVAQQAPEELAKIRTSLPPAAKKYGKKEYSTQPRNTHEPYIFAADAKLSHTAYVESLTLDFLEQQNHSDQPFFAISGFYAPHPPFNPPLECVKRYNREQMPTPKVTEQEKMSPELRRHMRLEIQQELQAMSDKDWQKSWQYYMAMVSHVDDSIGRIIERLKEQGIYDDTIIILTSDHGEFLGDHGRIQKGMPAYSSIVNVPFIIRYPQKIHGGFSDAIVEGVDVLPSLLELCGLPIPQRLEGQSFAKLCSKEQAEHKEEALVEYFDAGLHREYSIINHDFHYNVSSDSSEKLFDLRQDKAELFNVASDVSYAEALSDMRKKCLVKTLRSSAKSRSKIFEY